MIGLFLEIVGNSFFVIRLNREYLEIKMFHIQENCKVFMQIYFDFLNMYDINDTYQVSVLFNVL